MVVFVGQTKKGDPVIGIYQYPQRDGRCWWYRKYAPKLPLDLRAAASNRLRKNVF